MCGQPINGLVERQRREPEAFSKERLERLADTMEFKLPDKVPILFVVSICFLSRYYRASEIAFNYDTYRKAAIQAVEDFPVDAFAIDYGGIPSTPWLMALAIIDQHPELTQYFTSGVTGPMHDILRDKYTRWPGRELSSDTAPQFHGGEFMKVEEYSKLMENPAEFILKVIVPRTSENLSDPGSIRYVATLTKLMLEMQRCMDTYVKTLREVCERGMPALALGFTEAPLDFIGDFMRHPTNIPVDLYRHPDEVKRAAEAILPLLLKFAEASTPKKPLAPLPRLLYIPLHLNEMLSPKLYNEFYWPHLKKLITEACNKGVKPLIFFRGDHSPHIDTILELPRGWGIGYFERPKDFIKDVWGKLKGHTVVMGGIPNTLLREGTPEKIDEYVKNLLREVGPEPGFILAPGVEEIEPTTPTINVKALINAALKYGEYRR